MRVPAFVLSSSTNDLGILDIPQEVADTIKQEFARLLSQLLQLPIARWVGNPEPTAIVEATRKDNRCAEGPEVVLTMPYRSQLYASSIREFILRIREAHTIVPKSPQTLPDAGVQLIRSQLGFFSGCTVVV